MKKVIIGVVAIAIIALVVVGIVMVSGKNKENGGETTNAKMQTTQETAFTQN
jgi:glucose uptake protein GlcU